MVQAIAAKDVTLKELKQDFGLQLSQDPVFFLSTGQKVAKIDRKGFYRR